MTTVNQHSEETGIKPIEITRGSVLRMCIMMTHYRRPVDFSEKRMEEATKILESWAKACELCVERGCPVEVLECYCDDMNTAKAIAVMHGFRKDKKGKELFRTMMFLGLLGDNPQSIHEIKTLPNNPESNFGPDGGITV